MSAEIALEVAATNPNSDNQEMELESAAKPHDQSAGLDEANGTVNGKREREDQEVGEDEASKMHKVEKCAAEDRPEKKEDKTGVKLWAKEFSSSEEMFNYFMNFLHAWMPNVDINKYEHMMLLELLKKGHHEPEMKIKSGVRAFQIRYHPEYKSRCFFILREDNTVDDFSFRKCVDHILPLPEDMKVRHGGHRGAGYKGHHGGRGGGGRGRGRGGRGRY